MSLGSIYSQTTMSLSTANFHVQGRVESLGDSKFNLISPASSITFDFEGESTQCILQSLDSWQHHNYFSLIIDNQLMGRFKVPEGKGQPFLIQANSNGKHRVTLAKATEAASGTLVFDGSLLTNVIPSVMPSQKKIEFIGDSITCGAQSDASQTPCNEGQYFDQHNAYLAYGPTVARQLNASYTLSSVSGIGMYRNWNDEHVEEPIMPEVYSNLYLDLNASKQYESTMPPDVISICLGTNDLSDGDGKKPRLPFNAKKYIQNYCAFVEKLYERYPQAQIVLLSSPMLSGEKKTELVNALKAVQKYFKNDKKHKPIQLFVFETVLAHGCTGHPSVEDHQLMAAQLVPFFQKILHEN